MTRFLCLLVLSFVVMHCAKPSDGNASDEHEVVVTDSMQTTRYSFEVDGNTLVGLLDQPAGQKAKATIILVHGYGETNVVAQNWYYNLRSRFASIGINTLVWDKPGCGESDGTFDINQPVASSADEVVAAVRAIRKASIPGAEHVGLWGVSRAGWIAPLAMQAESGIDFWISVSGTDDKENARYLLESNFPIEGRSAEETEMLVAEWQAQFNTFWQGGRYQEYVDAAPNLRKDPFMALMGWDNQASRLGFLAYQRQFETGELVVDPETELLVYVPEFEALLSSLDKPVLALFGEKDTNVDWQATAALYRKTIGANPNASLTVKTFPDANHNMRQSATGGVREMQAQTGMTPYADGYFDVMLDWLQTLPFMK